MTKNRRHQLIITDAEKALLEMEEALTLIEDMSTAFRVIGKQALSEEPEYVLGQDDGQALRF